MVGGALASMVVLDQAWYADHERAPLHAFNDGREWLGMDKAGHAFSAYTLGAWGHALVKTCGTRDRTALWTGGMLGMVFLTGVEILDGTSAEWGFSWWDMAANAAGTGLFIGQQALWGEQRAVLKFSAHHTEYAAMRPALLGEGPIERYLKDYNGQTIWLSVNPGSFLPESRMPPWLNLAVGHGASGMVTAAPPTHDMPVYMQLERHRRLFLSPDLDLARLPVRGKGWRTVLFVLNSIKVPLPALEYQGRGRWRAHALYF